MSLFETYNENISQIEQAQYHLDQACELFYLIKEKNSTVLGIEEEIILKNQMANIAIKNNNLVLAEEKLMESQNIFNKKIQDSEEYLFNYGMTLHFFAILYWETEELKASLEKSQEALQIFQNISKTKSAGMAEIALCYNDMGIIHLKQKKYQEAKNFFVKSLEIRKKLFNFKHFSIVQSLNNLGFASKNINEFKESEKFYKEAVEMACGLYGEFHYIVVNCYNNIGNLYEESDNMNEAEKKYLRGFEICKKIYGDEHEGTKNFSICLERVYEKMGNVEKLLDLQTSKNKKKINLKLQKEKRLRCFDSCMFDLRENRTNENEN